MEGRTGWRVAAPSQRRGAEGPGGTPLGRGLGAALRGCTSVRMGALIRLGAGTALAAPDFLCGVAVFAERGVLSQSSPRESPSVQSDLALSKPTTCQIFSAFIW